MKKLCLALLALPLFAAAPTVPDWEAGMAIVPTAVAVVVSVPAPRFVRLDSLVLSNTTGSAATVTITDDSSNCNGGTCQPFPAISVPANSIVVADYRGARLWGGLRWSAGTSNAIQGYVAGRF